MAECFSAFDVHFDTKCRPSTVKAALGNLHLRFISLQSTRSRELTSVNCREPHHRVDDKR
jgi:hypothetical protein